MARIEKTVFISYRRTDVYTALAVYENLKNQGYDVFFDYRSISSGDFEQIISSNIKARAHFLLILTPTALDRCNEPGDWLRREIEVAIDEKRNIVPLFFKGFRFGAPSVTEKLTGKLKSLNRYNGLNVHEDYFDEAMHRLRTQYLNIPLNTVLHPVSTEVRKVVREEQIAADKALEQIEDVHEFVKQDHEKPVEPKAEPDPWRTKSTPSTVTTATPREDAADQPGAPASRVAVKPRHVIQKEVQDVAIPRGVTKELVGSRGFNFRLAGAIAGGLLVIGFLIWGAAKFLQNLPAATSEPTRTAQSSTTTTSQPEHTNTPSSIQTSTSPVPILGIGSTMISEKDGMTLLYVPAGEFTRGSTANQVDMASAECQKSFSDGCNIFNDEEPAHSINLDAFWIDKTEVTNEKYTLCVSVGKCELPRDTDQYRNSGYANYPVIYVSWNDALAYCTWAERRLPTEAEWEKAARGTDRRIYPWGNEPPDSDLLNYGEEIGETTPVGNYPKGVSAYGALDMAGNVWEWVADWYSNAYFQSPSSTNPLGPGTGTERVLKGGSWVNHAYAVRSANRHSLPPTEFGDFVGFRCAMSTTP